MAVFPLFINLKGKKCVVAGGGIVAARKVETLLAFDAEIIVVSPLVTERLDELKRENKLVHMTKYYSEEDIEGAFLVIAATDDSVVNERIYIDAEKRGIFVNVVDNPDKCTFIFPSIVKRSDLVIGISTSGTYPALSKSLRERLDGMLINNLDEGINKFLKECRQRALSEIKSKEKRKEILNRILDEAIFHGEIEDMEQLKIKIDNIFGEY